MQIDEPDFDQLLQPDFKSSLSALNIESPAFLLMRHSKRFPIPPGSRGKDIQLTEEGENMAFAFGKLYGHLLNHCYSSPVDRCVTTGNLILKGAQVNSTTQIMDLLGEPGAFIYDEELARPWLLDMNPVDMINHQLAGTSIPGVHRIEYGVSLFMNRIKQLPASPGKMYMFITHDSVMTCIIFHLIGCQATPENWPWELEGAIIQLKPGHQTINWRGRNHPIPERFLQ